MALAQRIGCRFGFTWNRKPVTRGGFHTIDGVERIFSADFISRHWLGETLDADAYPALDFEVISRAVLKQAASTSAILGWRLDRLNSLSRFKDTRSFFDLFRQSGIDPAAAFSRIEFSDEIRQAIEAAVISATRPIAAIHLRSGDIVHGRHRRFKYVTKVVPSTLTKALVSRLNSDGYDVLLVGQDSITLEYLKRCTAALTADDFGSRDFAPGTLREFFELSLLSRCTFLYAGNSQFAKLAALMRGRETDSPFDLMDWPMAAELVLAELDRHETDYHPLEAAFGYQWALSGLQPSLDAPLTRRIVERARALDPDNECYVLKLAATCFREGEFAEGEILLGSQLEHELASSKNKQPLPSLAIFSSRYARGPFLTEEELQAVSAGARSGCASAAIYCASFYQNCRRRADREMTKQRFLEFSGLARLNGAGHMMEMVEAWGPAKPNSKRRKAKESKK